MRKPTALSTLLLFFYCSLTSCSKVSTQAVDGPVGQAGTHTPVWRDTQGNEYGYYEYLPKQFSLDKRFPLLFYWNGANAISGNGREDLPGLLTQGLPKNIDEQIHYPLIIISTQLPNWKRDKVHRFVEYILHRYRDNIRVEQIYMSGFSAGGGISTRYALAYPEKIAAIVPVAPALHPLKAGQPTKQMARVSTWFFHNQGDAVVDPKITKAWAKALKQLGGEHHLTIYPVDGHYAWQTTYANQAVWEWLLRQRK